MKTFINEGNLYLLIGRSDKPQATRFMEWVCFEVLPRVGTCNMRSLLQTWAEKSFISFYSHLIINIVLFSIPQGLRSRF